MSGPTYQDLIDVLHAVRIRNTVTIHNLLLRFERMHEAGEVEKELFVKDMETRVARLEADNAAPVLTDKVKS